jgi:hypothetical protein
MAKWTKEMELYGELINVDGKEQYMKQMVANYNREYSKAFHMYKLEKSDLNQEFNWSFNWIKKKPIRRFKLLGQIVQEVLLVQNTHTKRYYRMPAREVAMGFKQKPELDKDI